MIPYHTDESPERHLAGSCFLSSFWIRWPGRLRTNTDEIIYAVHCLSSSLCRFSAMPFTCACFCGLNGFCRRQQKKNKEQVEEVEGDEGEEVERWRDQQTDVWQLCCSSGLSLSYLDGAFFSFLFFLENNFVIFRRFCIVESQYIDYKYFLFCIFFR